MKNEQILNETWKNTDKYLKQWLKDYKKINRKTRDKLQDIFNSINIEYKDINKHINKQEKGRLDRFIKDLKEKGLLSDYYGYKARLILNKSNVTYKEMLEIMILGCYIEENKTLDEYNNLLFYNVANDGYQRGLKDLELNPISLEREIVYSLLNIPLLNATAEEYLYSLALTNAEETFKKTLIDIQIGKKLNVDNLSYKELFLKQQNKLLKIDTMSGGIGNITDALNNHGYLQAGIDNNVKQCRFIAEIDKRTTKMCSTLDNLIFKLDDINVYQRYSEVDKKIITYRTKGLVLGENLPPINNHFHWCRSTITYNIYSDNSLIVMYNNLRLKKELNIPNTFEEFKEKVYNIHNYYEEMKEKELIYNDYKSQIEIGPGTKKIDFDDYHKAYKDSKKLEDFVFVNSQGIKEKLKGASIHGIYRMAERKIDLNTIKNILNNYEMSWYSEKHNSYDYTIDERVIVTVGVTSKKISSVMKRRKYNGSKENIN
ncbi:MAG: hypothetical protein E7161_04515 [Firmicutes bacterium]|nr:hypothetical protein [Bacillota bacterium]